MPPSGKERFVFSVSLADSRTLRVFLLPASCPGEVRHTSIGDQVTTARSTPPHARVTAHKSQRAAGQRGPVDRLGRWARPAKLRFPDGQRVPCPRAARPPGDGSWGRARRALGPHMPCHLHRATWQPTANSVSVPLPVPLGHYGT